MQLLFSSRNEHVLSKLEYEAMWQVYGHKIQHAFYEITGLPFKEDNIDSIVGDYESNFAGKTLQEPMLFRFSVRHKMGTIFHELAHRFLLEYRFRYTDLLENDHELIDLFLYDVIWESFGESAARERVAYECTFPELEIPNAWNKILKHPRSKRQELWKTVLENTLIYQDDSYIINNKYMKKREKDMSRQNDRILNQSETKTQDSQLKIYSTLSKKKEVFETLEDGKVRMYACGITASGDAHVGHALQAIVFDMIRKYLVFKGYSVTYVRNYTDIDDKIIASAEKQNIEPMQYARQIMLKTDAELDSLGVERPTIESRVTECMSDIIAFIEKLISKGHAYATDTGDVYFDVASFPSYGSFSNRILDQDIHNVRIKNEENKKDEKDFALWKSAKAGEISWDSPWGQGRPGWHIECSVMSIKYLGETLDIHGGGRDLVFPHHENEIAQSEAVTGKQFSRYWLHNGLIRVNGQKMSKSLGNSVILQNILERYNKDVIRLALLQNHYRSDVNITDCLFEKFEITIYSLYKAFYLIEVGSSGLIPQQDSPRFKQVSDSFTEAMDNDFNTPVVIANLFGYLAELNGLVSEKKFQEALNLMTAIKQIYIIIGICQMEAAVVISEIRQKHLQNNGITEEEILEYISKRAKYKAENNYAEADKIRDKLRAFSINIMDGREGSGWDLII